MRPSTLDRRADRAETSAGPPLRAVSASTWPVIVVGAAVAILVAADGSPGWRSLRFAFVLVATGLMASAVERPRRRSDALVALSTSVVGVSVGLAFGARFTVFDGLGWRAALGWIALAAGLVLVVAGIRAVARDRTRWRALAVGGTAFVLVVAAVRVVAPAVMATNVPPVPVADRSPADAGLEGGPVRFESLDGVELAGWYVPSRNGAAVVLRHGAGRSTLASVVDHAVVLADHGYGVLLTDARGHGDSGGRAMDYGWFGERDIEGAVTFLLGRPDVDAGRIAVVGMSMGGEEAIGAIGRDARIAAVVAEGATSRTAGDRVWMTDEFGWRGWVQRGLDVVQFGVVDLLTDAPRPATLADSAASAAPRPILLIAAGEVPDEGHAADHIRGSSPGNVDVWTVAGAGHTAGLDVARAEWVDRVIAFLDDAVGDGQSQS